MTPLRAKYIRDLVIHGRSKNTQEALDSCVPAKASLVDTLDCAAVFVSWEAPLSPSEVTGAAQLQLSIFWRQFNPAFQSCWHGNIRIQNPSRRRLCPIAHATFPRR